jgi:hypothetical protein
LTPSVLRAKWFMAGATCWAGFGGGECGGRCTIALVSFAGRVVTGEGNRSTGSRAIGARSSHPAVVPSVDRRDGATGADGHGVPGRIATAHGDAVAGSNVLLRSDGRLRLSLGV